MCANVSALTIYLMKNKIISMKTIKVKQSVKEELLAFTDAKSVNKAMRELLENAETHTHEIYSDESININMDDDLLEKLKQCKLSTSESHSDTIHRLILEQSKK